LALISQNNTHFINLSEHDVDKLTKEVEKLLINKPDSSSIFLYSQKKSLLNSIKDKYLNNINLNKNQKLFFNVGEGGEGIVFLSHNSELAVKIYKKDKDTSVRLEKLKLMVKNQIDVSGICWPIEEFKINNRHGYVMRGAKGIDLFLLLRKKTLEDQYPEVNRLYITKLAIKLLTKIKYLHDNSVLVGDINLMNILIDIPNSYPYMIDTDSFQIGNYPCPVGSVNFTAPEIQGKDFSKFLRLEKHEFFSIATLLFIMYHAGKSPYSYAGGGDPGKNIINKNFPYPFLSGFNFETPNGIYENMWNYLSFKMKEAFYNTFKRDIRINIEDWISLLKHYKNDIEQDRVHNELFPESYLRLADPGTTKYDGEWSGGNPKNIINNDGKGFGIIEMSSKALKLLYVKNSDNYFTNDLTFSSFKKVSLLVNAYQYLGKSRNFRMHLYKDNVLPKINELKLEAIDNGLKYLYVYGTSIYRAAKNRDKLLEMVKNITSLDAKIISTSDESKHNYDAYKFLIKNPHSVIQDEFNFDLIDDKYHLLFEFGSGSIRLSLFNPQHELIWVNVNPNGYESLKNTIFLNHYSTDSIKNVFYDFDLMIDSLLNNLFSDLPNLDYYRIKLIGLGGPFSKIKNAPAKDYHNTKLNINQIDKLIIKSQNKLQDYPNLQNLKKGTSSFSQDKFPHTKVYNDQFILRVGLPIIKKIMSDLEIGKLTLSGATLWYGLYYYHLNKSKGD
tara:strand:- start:177 stop:2354 length:2178 start_codon:yes stop_codon:yes gene_type:complete